jgi:hypothetical protein
MKMAFLENRCNAVKKADTVALPLRADLTTVQTSSKIMFRRDLKTVKTVAQMCQIR